MKTRIFLVVMLITAFFTTSCSFKETMVINDDGSGTISFTIDASEMLSINNSLASANDSIMLNRFGVEINRGVNNEGRQEEYFSFKDFFKEEENKAEIEKLPEEERDVIMRLSNVELKTVMDKEKNESTYNIVTKFDNVEEVYGVMQGINHIFTATEGGGKNNFIPYMWDNNRAEGNYFYDGKKFVKKVIPGRKPATAKKSPFNAFPYTISYTFPKEIKYVSYKDAIVSNDKRTVTITYDLEDYLDNVEGLSLEVEFK